MQKKSDPTIDWQDVADFRAEELELNENVCTIRKGAKLFYEYANAGWIKDPRCASINKDENLTMRKDRQKLSDARVEYNRLIRQEARKESFLDLVKEVLCQNLNPLPLRTDYTVLNEHKENDLLISCTDLHTGITINNFHNKFDENILTERISNYVNKIIEIKQTHKAENSYIVIGELVSGIIHDNLRLQNNMDLMEQFKYACELVAAMLAELSKYFVNIYVYTTPGNHSRIVAAKEKSLAKENIDLLAPFYLRARLQNYENIIIKDNEIDPMIAVFDIRGNTVVSAHGDKDSPENVVQNMTLMLRKNINIVLLGHRHTNGLKTVNDTKVISAGCCSGADSFANDLRKRNRPEQIVAVVNKDGIDCLYDVQID